MAAIGKRADRPLLAERSRRKSYNIDGQQLHTAVKAVSRYLPLTVPVQRRRGSAVRCDWLSGIIVSLAPEYNMGGFLRRDELNAFVSQCAHVNPLE